MDNDLYHVWALNDNRKYYECLMSVSAVTNSLIVARLTYTTHMTKNTLVTRITI